MLRVYSYEKPARPLLGPIFAAAALAATLSAAWGLRELRAAPEPLGERVRLPGWPVSFSAPRDWVAAAEGGADRGESRWRDEITFQSAARGNVSPDISIFYDTTGFGLTPGVAANIAASRRMGGALGASEVSTHSIAVGPLLGTLREIELQTQRGLEYVLVGAAGLPNGRLFGVAVQGAGRAGPPEHRLLRSVCGSMEMVTPRLGRRPEELGGNPPILCAAPPHGWIVSDREEESPGFYLTSDAASGFAWGAQVLPTFLALGRTTADLAQDYVENQAYQVSPLPVPGMSRSGPNDSSVVQYVEDGQAVCARFIDLGNHRAAFVMGFASGEDLEALARICAEISGSVRVAPSAQWPYPVAAAEDLGPRRLGHFMADGAKALLSGGSGHEAFISEIAGSRVGRLESVREPARQGPSTHRGSQTQSHHRPGERRPVLEARSKWAMNAETLAFQVEEEIVLRSGSLPMTVSTSTRSAGGEGPLQVTVRVGERSRRGTLRPAPGFVPDPLIDPVRAAVAAAGGDDPLILQYISLSTERLSAAYLQRRRPAAGDDEGGDATHGMFEVRDFDPAPVRYDFDGDRRLLRMTFGLSGRRVRSDGADSGEGDLINSIRRWVRPGARGS